MMSSYEELAEEFAGVSYAPVTPLPTRGPITSNLLQRVRSRHEAKVQAAIESLGEKYLCHPINKVKRIHRGPHTVTA